MRSLPITIAVVLSLSQLSDAVAQGAGQLGGSLEPGSYAVGFRTLYMRDTTRAWHPTTATATARDPGRPIRISYWYPAAHDQRSPAMSYGDYFHYDGPADFRPINDTLEKSDRESWRSDLMETGPNGGDLLSRLFATRVAARHDATPAAGRFPVLLYAAGKGSRADANVELGEYLASHGYIVATVPQLGPSEANIELGSSPEEIRLHEQDLDFAWSILRRLPSVDASRLAIAGHSAGGEVAIQYGMDHSEVGAVIGLDGSYGMYGEGQSAKTTRSRANGFPEFAPTRFTAPLLDMRRANGVQGATLDSSVVAALHASDRYVVTIPRMYHGDFTEWAPIGVFLGDPWKMTADGRTRQTGLEGNEHAYRALLDFLDATVRHDPHGIDAMHAELRGVAGVTVTHRPPRAHDGASAPTRAHRSS